MINATTILTSPLTRGVKVTTYLYGDVSAERREHEQRETNRRADMLGSTPQHERRPARPKWFRESFDEEDAAPTRRAARRRGRYDDNDEDA